MDCIFCKIGKKEMPAQIVYEDEDVIAFNDINPKALIHILIIPKKHISSVNDLSPEDNALAGKLLLTAKKIAGEQGIGVAGYKILINTGKNAGQIVNHIHLHLLSGHVNIVNI